MAKICLNQVYRQVYERNSDEILLAKSERREVLRYRFSDFAADMRAGDLISSTKTIKEKWEALVANSIIMDSRGSGLKAWGFLHIGNLEVKVEGRATPFRELKGARACLSGFYIQEQNEAEEGSE